MKIVGREFVLSGRHPPTLPDLVEEPFDQVSRAIQIRTEADRVFAVALRRNVRPCPLLSGTPRSSQRAGRKRDDGEARERRRLPIAGGSRGRDARDQLLRGTGCTRAEEN